MRLLRYSLFVLDAAWQNFWRNAAASVTALLSIGLILVLAGTGLLLGHALAQVLGSYGRQVSVITIGVADGTPLASVADFEAQLRQRPDVASVRFLTKQQELRQFASDPRNQAIVQQLVGNPIPARIQVQVRSLADVARIDALARTWPGVDQSDPTDYQGQLVDNMLRLERWLDLGGLGLLAVLAVVSVVIVMNAIRSAVYHRRREIEIMKLVGGTEWLVRAPFLLEGLLTGLLAAALAQAVLALAYHPFVEHFSSALFFLPLTYDPRFLDTLAVELLTGGAVLGVLGSYVAVRRHVRV